MGLGIPTASASAETVGTKIDFGRDIQPILANRCFKCHGPDAKQRQAGVRLDSMEHLTAETDSGLVTVTAALFRTTSLWSPFENPMSGGCYFERSTCSLELVTLFPAKGLEWEQVYFEGEKRQA